MALSRNLIGVSWLTLPSYYQEELGPSVRKNLLFLSCMN